MKYLSKRKNKKGGSSKSHKDFNKRIEDTKKTMKELRKKHMNELKKIRHKLKIPRLSKSKRNNRTIFNCSKYGKNRTIFNCSKFRKS